ncbi:alpha-galactosidase [Mahella australiensis]|uniref:Alpha-galactosidase n=1 Tax=Mahella australiensis (strain DSM 15567 / CIP 107919 / 50-1 BON) TaxID=697281 RepID=F3ZYQ2_MAHA5|nr:alpha-galactosidase [Mahella australiensis]AEE97820.1 Alpha-galactosidase [Mahella australiensis 50-1 BON]
MENKSLFRYHSGLGLYAERFEDGMLVCVDYEDNGIPRKDKDQRVHRPAFNLTIDGESLYFGWEYQGFTREISDQNISKSVLELKHSVKPIRLRIHTECFGNGFFRRYMEITNISESESLGLTSVIPICGEMWYMSDNLVDNLKDESVLPYSVGYFKDVAWGQEGNFAWSDIPSNTSISFGSDRGRSGWNNPFFILRNNIYGGYFICNLAWSANWKAVVHNNRSVPSAASLVFEMSPVAPAPMRIISPGETVKIPEVHFGIGHQDLDSLIQNQHKYLRGNVLKKSNDGIQPVMYNHWGYTEDEISEESLKREVDIAAEIGAELFIVDAGWYADKGTSWWNNTGYWYAGDRLPNDLFPVFEYAREKGLKCGLWVEIESASKDSKIATEHPDWFITRYGKRQERILDLANPEVKEYMEEEIIRLIERYDLNLFRLDYNMNADEGGFNLKNGKMENTLWRHVESLYEIFDKMRTRFPNVLFENCSSGGGRTDLGMVSRFTTTWISDWMRMPRTVRILNGMSMVLPPEYLNRTFGVIMEGSYRGNIETQLHNVIMAHPTISGISPQLSEANPEGLECVKKYITIYKDFIRPLQGSAKVYHHTPNIAGADGTGWCALEYASPDGKKCVAAVFRLINSDIDTYTLKYRGLKEDKSYRVTVEPGTKTFIKDGYSLMHDGLNIKLDNALTSNLTLLEAID